MTNFVVRDGNGNRLNSYMKGDGSSSLPFIPNYPYRNSVARNDISGSSIWNKFGYNADVDSASNEIIAAFGGTFQIMTTDEILTLVSTSANDSSASIGARSVSIFGIGSDFTEQTETVILNGTSSVNTVNTWLGINRMFVSSSGTNQVNEGTITATSSTFSVQASIPDGDGVTQQAIFHTPISKNFLAEWLAINCRKLSGGTAPRVTVRGYSFSRVTNTNYEIFRWDLDTSIENSVFFTPPVPFIIGGREVLYFTAETNTNDTIVGCRFSGILENS